MRILVTGASGFVGRCLCVELRRQAHVVVTAVRSAITKNDDFEQAIIGSIDSVTDWSEALRNVDVVIHLAARVHVMNDHTVNPLAEFRKTNVAGTLNLAKQAAMAGAKRFIFISSIKVNGEFTEIGKPFTEEVAANPQDAYGVSKFEAEQGLLLIARQTGMEAVIIRPPLVYGPGVKANFARIMQFVKHRIPLPFGAIHNKRSFVYVGNLVSLILRCIECPGAANQTFLVSDGCDISTTDLLRECAVALAVKSILLPVPQSLIEFCGVLIGKKDIMQRLCGDLQVDITKARIFLGWTPPVSVAAGLKATALGLTQGDNK